MHKHPVTGMNIEDGRGAHPEHVQVQRHCDEIEKSGDVKRADAMRKELGIPTSEDLAAAAKAAAEAKKSEEQSVSVLYKRIVEVEAKVAELFGLHAAKEPKDGGE